MIHRERLCSFMDDKTSQILEYIEFVISIIAFREFERNKSYDEDTDSKKLDYKTHIQIIKDFVERWREYHREIDPDQKYFEDIALSYDRAFYIKFNKDFENYYREFLSLPDENDIFLWSKIGKDFLVMAVTFPNFLGEGHPEKRGRKESALVRDKLFYAIRTLLTDKFPDEKITNRSLLRFIRLWVENSKNKGAVGWAKDSLGLHATDETILNSLSENRKVIKDHHRNRFLIS